jgi:hypothetical protein
MSIDNRLFIRNLPDNGYHVFGGKIKNDIQKGYSFVCGCGKTHYTRETFALREHRNEGTAIYCCPDNNYILNIVKPVGFFRVKGIETIASFLSDPDDSVYSKILAFREIKEQGISTLSEYFATQS